MNQFEEWLQEGSGARLRRVSLRDLEFARRMVEEFRNPEWERRSRVEALRRWSQEEQGYLVRAWRRNREREEQAKRIPR